MFQGAGYEIVIEISHNAFEIRRKGYPTVFGRLDGGTWDIHSFGGDLQETRRYAHDPLLAAARFIVDHPHLGRIAG